MKRLVLLVVGILSALVVAAPMVYAQSDNGAAPEEYSVTYGPEFIAQYPGHCSFPMQLEVSGKTKTVEQGNGIDFAVTSIHGLIPPKADSLCELRPEAAFSRKFATPKQHQAMAKYHSNE